MSAVSSYDEEDDGQLPSTQTTTIIDTDDELLEEEEEDCKTKDEEQMEIQKWGRLVAENEKYPNLVLEGMNPFWMGRKGCSYLLEEKVVSNKHCKISKNEGVVLLEDFSTNGTFVNGMKVAKSFLKNGDKISLASADSFLSYIFQDLTVKAPRISKEERECGIYDKYDIIEVIGQGNFSTVHLGVNKMTGERVAIKAIDLTRNWHPKSLLQIEREVDILRGVEHENIISIRDTFRTRTHLYVILELATGGDLFEKISQNGACEEDEGRYIFRQILEAVSYLHRKEIAHRDLKPENILISSKKDFAPIKLTDFGLARIIGEKELARTLCGTPQYVAPEVIAQAKDNWHPSLKTPEGYGKACDMWSLGAILYVILSGCPPFTNPSGGSRSYSQSSQSSQNTGQNFVSDLSLFEQISFGVLEFPIELWYDISDSAINLITRLMTEDPNKRLTVEEALLHPWLREGPVYISQQNAIHTPKRTYQDQSVANTPQLHTQYFTPSASTPIQSLSPLDSPNMSHAPTLVIPPEYYVMKKRGNFNCPQEEETDVKTKKIRSFLLLQSTTSQSNPTVRQS
eukprot:TRINITY_DN3107_c0_g1_i1.p1 TRINITY_DN3107_c0_g1~~TRINITY_DN3107_c0_g1_i1.p1  ORF type:complete len:570 (-),score=111.51 TRINITY_DN3107_c0_g1_i1:84-1793(-)